MNDGDLHLAAAPLFGCSGGMIYGVALRFCASAESLLSIWSSAPLFDGLRFVWAAEDDTPKRYR
jgi:hypothetical protein